MSSSTSPGAHSPSASGPSEPKPCGGSAREQPRDTTAGRTAEPSAEPTAGGSDVDGQCAHIDGGNAGAPLSLGQLGSASEQHTSHSRTASRSTDVGAEVRVAADSLKRPRSPNPDQLRLEPVRSVAAKSSVWQASRVGAHPVSNVPQHYRPSVRGDRIASVGKNPCSARPWPAGGWEARHQPTCDARREFSRSAFGHARHGREVGGVGRRFLRADGRRGRSPPGRGRSPEPAMRTRARSPNKRKRSPSPSARWPPRSRA